MAAYEVVRSNCSKWERLCSGLAHLQWERLQSGRYGPPHIGSLVCTHHANLHLRTMPGPTRLLYSSEICDHLYGTRK